MPTGGHNWIHSPFKPLPNVIIISREVNEATKDGQLLNDIFIGRKTFYALSGIRTHAPLITGWV